MAVVVTIGGTEVGYFPGSLSCDDKLGSIPSAALKIKVAPSGSLSDLRGKEIIISDNVVTETINLSVDAPTGPWGRTLGTNAYPIEIPYQAMPAGTTELVMAPLAESEFGDSIIGVINYESRWFDLEITSERKIKLTWYTNIGESNYKHILNGNTILALGKCYEISFSWETNDPNASVHLYINGVLDAEDTQSGTVAQRYADPTRIQFGNFINYHGDIRLWNICRTAEAILADKLKRLTGSESGLVGYWKTNEGTGFTIYDSTSGGNDGTLDEDQGEWIYAPENWSPGEVDVTLTCQPTVTALKYFGGYISGQRISNESDAAIVLDLKAEGYSSICPRYLPVSLSSVPQTGKYLMQGLAVLYLAGMGIKYKCMPSGSPLVYVSDSPGRYLNAIYDEIARSTLWIWYIDAYKELRYHPRTYRSAPFNIAASDSPAHYMPDSMEVEQDKTGYYNSITARIRYTDDADVEHVLLLNVTDPVEIAARIVAEGGTGIYEHYEDISNANSPEHGLDLAYGKLKAASTMGKTVSYVTTEDGLRVGDAQTITLPAMGLSGSFVVESIKTVEKGGYLFYTVQLTSWKRDTVEQLADLLSNSLEEKRNWNEVVAADGYGKIIDIDGDIYCYELVGITGGTIADESKWDVGKWDFMEWQ